MLNELFEGLCTLLAPLDLPIFLADCIPDGVSMPYLTMALDVPATPADTGKATLTVWCDGGSANAERIRLFDELTARLPLRGICLRMAEHAVTLCPTGNLTCNRSKTAIALRMPLALTCVPLLAPVDCTLDGSALTDIADTIHILGVHEDAPQMRLAAYPCLGGGTRTLLHQRESLSIRIDFCIHDPDRASRQKTLGAVAAWSEKGGMLRLSTRPGQWLRIDRATLSALASEEWTDLLCVTLTASAAPWWEGTQPVSAAITASGTLTTPGDTGFSPVDVGVTNLGEGTLTRLTLACGDTQMAFEGLSLPAGEALTLAAAQGMMTALIAQTSVLDKRTALSDDLLMAPCGRVCAISVTADQPVTAEFTARGRYL